MSYISGMKVDQADTSPQFTVGTIGVNAAKGSASAKKYKYVKYNQGAGTVAAVIGQVAYYYLVAGYKTGEVTSDLSDSINLAAGVLQSAITNGGFGWVQIAGPATLSIALTAGSDGVTLTATGATDGTLDILSGFTQQTCALADDISAREIICMFPE